MPASFGLAQDASLGNLPLETSERVFEGFIITAPYFSH